MEFVTIGEYTVNTAYIQYALEYHGDMKVIFGSGAKPSSATVTHEQWKNILAIVARDKNPSLGAGS